MFFFPTADLPARNDDLHDGYQHVAYLWDAMRVHNNNPEGEPVDYLTRAVWNAARWADVFTPRPLDRPV
jgi:hypothetical protein